MSDSTHQSENNYIKRYDFAPECCDGDSGKCDAEMQQDPEGNWIKIVDVVAFINDMADNSMLHYIGATTGGFQSAKETGKEREKELRRLVVLLTATMPTTNEMEGQ